MKRFLTILLVAVVLTLCVAPAFAAAEGEVQTESEPVTPVVDQVPVTVILEDNTPVVVTGTDAGYLVRSAFMSALVSIFGEYTPRTQTVTTYFADGSSIQSVEYVQGIAGLDWVWISGVVLFCIVIYCIFRMIGGVLKWS